MTKKHSLKFTVCQYQPLKLTFECVPVYHPGARVYPESMSLTYFYTSDHENIKGCVTFCTLVDYNL